MVISLVVRPALCARRRDREVPPVHWPTPLLIPEELEDSADVPDFFKCSITLSIMKEPAQTPAGVISSSTSL